MDSTPQIISENPLYDRLIDFFGGSSAAARALSVGPSAVDNWRTRGLPPHRALDIEKATKGAISARDILKARSEG